MESLALTAPALDSPWANDSCLPSLFSPWPTSVPGHQEALGLPSAQLLGPRHTRELCRVICGRGQPFLSQSLAELNPEVGPRTTAFPGMFGVGLASGGGGHGKEALGGH